MRCRTEICLYTVRLSFFYKYKTSENVILKFCKIAAVSYTHLDVYKRQDQNHNMCKFGQIILFYKMYVQQNCTWYSYKDMHIYSNIYLAL